MSKTEQIENYTQAAINIANDDTHGYSQIHRKGNPDFDCSSLVIYVVKQAGIPVGNASYTGNMYSNFICNGGFKDVTKTVNLKNGTGLKRGDILIRPYRHTSIYVGQHRIVHARCDESGTYRGTKTGDQTGKEIAVTRYINYPYTYVLRLI